MNDATAHATVNGFDTAALGGLAETLADHPEGGRVSFRSTSCWNGGAAVGTRLRGYVIDGRLCHEEKRRFDVTGDEPAEFGAAGGAPAPPEMLMHAVANCILATTNAYAALKGIALTRLEARLESDVDLHGMFGLNGGSRPGLGEIRVSVAIEGDADAAELEKLVELGIAHSPMRDSVENGVPLRARIAPRGNGS